MSAATPVRRVRSRSGREERAVRPGTWRTRRLALRELAGLDRAEPKLDRGHAGDAPEDAEVLRGGRRLRRDDVRVAQAASQRGRQPSRERRVVEHDFGRLLLEDDDRGSLGARAAAASAFAIRSIAARSCFCTSGL